MIVAPQTARAADDSDAGSPDGVTHPNIVNITNVGAAVHYSADAALVNETARMTQHAAEAGVQAVTASAQSFSEQIDAAAAGRVKRVKERANAHVEKKFAMAEERISAMNKDAEKRIQAERELAAQQQHPASQAVIAAQLRIEQLEAQLQSSAMTMTSAGAARGNE